MATVTQDYVLKVTADGLKEILNEIKALRKDMAGMSNSADKVSAGMNKAGKSAGEYDRNMKGAAKATNNGTKSFSKMAQGMQGTLVPAYATVAANVFALTAAFGALERAADTQILIKASEELAAQTGRSLISVSKNMKEITGNAISMKEALTSASIAASAGFDNSTIEELTQVARNASVALGRDMTDSLNRVFKGAIKAEPELLDELGIILRLDPATREYAASIGKAVSELTTFEKQQAVVNAVLEQGQEKFGTLGDVDPNPYTQLASSFSDVSNSLISMVGVPISPVIKFFSENTTALTAALLIFANSVLQRAIPAIASLSEGFQDLSAKKLTGLGNTIEGLEVFFNVLDDSKIRGSSRKLGATKVIEELDHTMDNFNHNLNDHTKNIRERYDEIWGDNALTEDEKLTQLTSVLKAGVKELSEEYDIAGSDIESSYDHLVDASVTAQVATSKSFRGMRAAALGFQKVFGTTVVQGILKGYASIAAVGTGAFTAFTAGMAEGVDGVNNSIIELRKHLNSASGSTVLFEKQILGLSKGIGYLGVAFGKLIKFIPYIGQLVIAWQILGSAITGVLNLFRDNEAIESTNKAIEDQEEAIKTASSAIERYNKTLKNAPKTLSNVTKSLEVQKNILLELNNANKEVVDNTSGFTEFFGSDLEEYTENLNNQLEILQKLGATTEVNEVLEKFGINQKIIESTALEAGERIAQLTDRMLKLTDAASESKSILKDTFDGLDKGFKSIQGGLPTLNGLQQTFVNITSLLGQLNTLSVSEQASAITGNISSYGANLAGISEEIGNITTQQNFLNPFIDKQVELKNKIDEKKKAIEEETTAWEFLKEATVEYINKGLNKALDIEIDTDRIKLKKELVALQEEEKTYSDVAVKGQEKIADNLKTAKQKLEEYRTKLEETVYAQSNLNKLTQQLQFEKTLPGVSDNKALEITDKIAEAQIRAINLSITQASKAITAVTKVSNKAKEEIDAINKITQERDLTPEETEKLNKYTKEYADSLTQNIQLMTTTADLQRKITDERIKQFDEYRKKLDEITKKEGLEIKVDETSEDFIINKIEPLLETLGVRFSKLGKSTSEWKNEIVSAFNSMAAFSALQVNIGGASPESIAKQSIALDERMIALDAEREYLKLHNSLLDERLDKEFLLTAAEAERRLDTVQTDIESGKLSGPELEKALQIEKELYELIGKTGEAGSKLIDTQIAQENIKLKLANDRVNTELAAGLRLTVAKKAELKYQAELEKLAKRIGEYTSEQVEEQKKLLKEQKKLTIKSDLSSQLSGAIDSASTFSDIMKELRENLAGLGDDEPFAKFQSGLLAINKIAEESGDKSAKSLSQLSIIFANHSQQMAEYEKKVKEVGEEQAQAFKPDNIELAASAMGALGNAFDDGSQAAETFKLAQMALATVSAVNAVLEQGKGDPYTAFARMAAMAASVAALLSQADIAFSGGGGGSGTTAASARESMNISSYGVVGGPEILNDSLGEGLDRLVDINTDLYGAERDLVMSIIKLDKSFKEFGSAIFQQAGSFSAGNILDIFGVTFGTEFDPGLFNDETITTELISAGIQFTAIFEETADGIVGVLDNANAYLTYLETETDSGFFGIGGGTDTDIRTRLSPLGDRVVFAVEQTLTNTFDVISGLIGEFSSDIADTDLAASFNTALEGLQKLDLADKSPEEQSKVLSSFLTGISDTVLMDLVPSLYTFNEAGETLIDTLVRLAERTIALNNIFSRIGETTESLSGANELGPRSTAEEQAYFKTLEGDILAAQLQSFYDLIAFTEPWMSQFTATDIGRVETLIDEAGFADELDKLFPDGLGQFGKEFVKEEWGEFLGVVEAAIVETDNELGDLLKQIRSFNPKNIVVAWEEALVGYFKNEEEYQDIFNRAIDYLFSPEELAKIAERNALAARETASTEFSTMLDDLGIDIDFDPKNTTQEYLNSLYFRLEEEGAFAAKYDKITGEIVYDGAELLGAFYTLAAAQGELATATEEVAEEIDNFIRDLQRQIDAFGLAGKELELLELSFDFEDMIEQAEGDADKIIKVEELFGLRRLEIIKRYHEEIADAINAAYSGINDAILTIYRSTDTWDELAYLTARESQLMLALNKSMGTLSASGGGLTGMMRRVGRAMLLAGVTFEGLFEQIVPDPDDVEGQIDLVNQLKDITIERYNEELRLINEQKTQYEEMQDISKEIGDYLQSLIVSDLSPLTTAERLDAAQSNFADLLLKAQGGDVEAARQLTSASDTLLDLASQQFGIGPQFQAIWDSTTSDLTDFMNTSAISAQVGLSGTEAAIKDLQTTTLDKLDFLEGILGVLETEEYDRWQQEIASTLSSIAAESIDAATSLRLIGSKLAELDFEAFGVMIDQAGYPTATTDYIAPSTTTTVPEEYPIELFNPAIFDIGAEEIPYDQLAMVHKGEMILTPEMSEAVRAGRGIVSNNTGQNVENYFSTGDSGTSNAEIVQAIKVLTEVLAVSQEEIIEQQSKALNKEDTSMVYTPNSKTRIL